MNKQTRAQLEEYYDQLNNIVAAIRKIGESEQEKFDNAPENLQESERVQAWADCAYFIDSICNNLECHIERIMNEIVSEY